MPERTRAAKSRTEAAHEASSLTRMNDRIFERFSEFIKSELGIKMPSSKKTLLEARLQKRLRELGMGTHEEYCEYLFSPQGMENELVNLVDVVTTNTTDFFREPKHFDLLMGKVLPELHARGGSGRNVNIWSAGCSSGEEPYTLAMVLSEFARQNAGFTFSILATDISTQVLRMAVRAIYPETKIGPIPQEYRKRYLLRSKDRTRRLVRIGPDARCHVRFRRLNFMEDFSFDGQLDIIFCRNVVIYFDRPTQETLFSRFCRKLAPGGYLFIGHSESLAGMDLPLEPVAPTVYRKV
ncbi:MAG TPA: protein-glutamate O-methyltransferase [Humidesulfovibrio sp.]|uniref:CheR family methyltransferase n=1 Tax=Humidesulfovibrio sp. TaxID=2910988 RepID=UPI002C9D7250|nr:protein-glutamate O-methyltransferase [Humidesulfovibrio sp.]HWR02923.1 protein-glutamate O-methyltransferase [Humidesulfovibrio sp.]